MLIVLDDARDAAQVSPLLPGAVECGVIITTRQAIAGPVDAEFLSLDVLSPGEAEDLFMSVVGPERVWAEPAAAADVLTACGGLPLAIRNVANCLAIRPGLSIAHLAARLADRRTRLSGLSVGERTVRASFAVSYETLVADHGPAAARLFRLLGSISSPEVTLAEAAVLGNHPEAYTAGLLRALSSSHLVRALSPDQFCLHPLLHSYAGELAEQMDDPKDRRLAVTRLLAWQGSQG
jgi:hypothetical protein